MKEYCKAKVHDGRGVGFHDCTRWAVKDGFCKQHHPDAEKERAEKSRVAYEARQKREPWYLLGEAREKLDAARKEIERLQEALDVEKGWVSKYRYAHCEQVAEIERLKKWQREMVEKAAAKSLDGYRELGAKCAALEKERDEARAEVKALKQGGHDESDHEEIS